MEREFELKRQRSDIYGLKKQNANIFETINYKKNDFIVAHRRDQ